MVRDDSFYASGILRQWNPAFFMQLELWNNLNGFAFMFFYGSHGGMNP